MTTTQATPPPAPQETPASDSTSVEQAQSVTADSTQPQAEPKNYVTREELANAVELGVRRAQQSARDRSQQLERSVKALTDQFQKFGGTVTPEVTQKIRHDVEQQLDQQLESPAPQQADSSSSANEPGPGNPVFDWTQTLYNDEGIKIEPNDPEFAAIKTAIEDPAGSFVKYQKVVFRAVETKRERIASAQETADARVMGSGSSNATVLGPDVNPLDLFQAAHRQ